MSTENCSQLNVKSWITTGDHKFIRALNIVTFLREILLVLLRSPKSPFEDLFSFFHFPFSPFRSNVTLCHAGIVFNEKQFY